MNVAQVGPLRHALTRVPDRSQVWWTTCDGEVELSLFVPSPGRSGPGISWDHQDGTIETLVEAFAAQLGCYPVNDEDRGLPRCQREWVAFTVAFNALLDSREATLRQLTFAPRPAGAQATWAAIVSSNQTKARTALGCVLEGLALMPGKSS